MNDTIFTKHFTDLMFTVVAEPMDYRVEYMIYEIVGFLEKDGVKHPMWQRANQDCYPDCVEDLKESETYISGSVKWDGCSNWNIDENTRGSMLHGCCREDLQRLGDIMAQCWDWTKELIPDTWDGE